MESDSLLEEELEARIIQVCGIDLQFQSKQKKETQDVARALAGRGVTPDQIARSEEKKERWTCSPSFEEIDNPAWEDWWYMMDYRGRDKKEPPNSPKTILETWGKFEKARKNPTPFQAPYIPLTPEGEVDFDKILNIQSDPAHQAYLATLELD